jgi:hypothetical protein
MRKTIILMILALALISLPVASRAQSTTLSLTSGGTPTVTGTVAGTPASTQSAVGTTLTATLNFGDVSPKNTNGQVIIVMPIRLSTLANYTVKVQRTAIPATSGVQAGDIGFGVGNFRPQRGTLFLNANAISGIVVTSPFGNDPTAAANDVDGQPQFLGTLNNISTTTGTTIFTGPAITWTGVLANDLTSILADLTFVIVPQFFASTASFTTTLTITIS